MLDTLLHTFQSRHGHQNNWHAYLAWRQNYSFDMVLDYNHFSYVLEGFCSSGHIRLHHSNVVFGQSTPMLSLPLTHLMLHFSQHARAMPADDWPSYAHVASIFVQFMKSTIACAKYDPTAEGEAARQLLAFLMYQNIHVQHGSEVVTMQNIFLSEASYDEKAALFAGPAAHPFRFIYTEWQQQQHYPGKGDLENILNGQSNAENEKAILNHYPLMKSQSSPQLRVTSPVATSWITKLRL